MRDPKKPSEGSPEIRQNPVSYLLEATGDMPYREFIQLQITKQSARRLVTILKNEIKVLPEHLRALAGEYIDGINHRFARDEHFWETVTCKDCFLSIMETAIELLPIDDMISSSEDALCPENQLLAFQLYQIATLSLSYCASVQGKQRKLMGIRKGIFG